jgi:hypothetical protein
MRRPSRPSRRADRSRAPREPDGPPEEQRPAARAAESDRLAGYRLIRRIASGDRADVYLAAEVSNEGSPPGRPGAASDRSRAALVALRVYDADADGAVVAVEVEAMAQVGALPRLHDLATLADGRTCVVVERLAGPNLAQVILERGLSCGEAVTVLAPIAVAMGELERHGFAHTRLASSDVLFDASGRPRLIGTGAVRDLDVGTDPAARTGLLRDMYAAYARLVGEVAAATRPAGSLDPVTSLMAELLETRPFRPRPAEIERTLFALATPKPVLSLPGAVVLGTAAHRLDDAHARDRIDPTTGPIWESRSLAPAPQTASRWLPAAFASASGLVDDAFSHGDSHQDVAMQPAGWLARLGARGRSALAARRGVLIVGGLAGAAALVLALTLVPPADEDPGAQSAHALDPSASPVGDATDAPVESLEPHGPPGASPAPPPDDATVVAATVELLRRRETCFADLEAACLDEVLQPGSGIDEADRVAMLAAQGGDHRGGDADSAFTFDAAHVTGRMGDAWLVEVPHTDGERQPASVLVMRSEAGWRLREIFG